ncbi:MAG: hypothetical protein IPJ41_05815 [Phycisphaerales bacterium]|nr:hypothetical protein [Phycisphaerales bacterium]
MTDVARLRLGSGLASGSAHGPARWLSAAVLLAASCATGWGQQTIEIREGLLAQRLGQAGRAPFFTDPVALAYARGESVHPSAGDALTLGDKSVEWEAGKADDDGVFRGRAMAGGYLYATVESDRDRAMILDARGDSLVYVNDELRSGDPYGNGLLRVPVMLRRGDQLAALPGRERGTARDAGRAGGPDRV